MRNNSISFTSNIIFVNNNTFNNVKKGLQVTMRNMAGFDTDIWTRNIRTCTGGGIVSCKGVAGFHVVDNLDNLHDCPNIMKSILRKTSNYKNALIIGSKTYENYVGEYSVALFRKLKDELSRSVKHVSSFEEHKQTYGQTHIHYSKDNDTWYVCSEIQKYVDSTPEPVDTKEKLLRMFKKISIAKTDRLFIQK